MKTPVSVLQEVLSKRGITPSYELVQIEGAIHEPTFRYRVSFHEKDGKLHFDYLIMNLYLILYAHLDARLYLLYFKQIQNICYFHPNIELV